MLLCFVCVVFDVFCWCVRCRLCFVMCVAGFRLLLFGFVFFGVLYMFVGFCCFRLLCLLVVWGGEISVLFLVFETYLQMCVFCLLGLFCA